MRAMVAYARQDEAPAELLAGVLKSHGVEVRTQTGGGPGIALLLEAEGARELLPLFAEVREERRAGEDRRRPEHLPQRLRKGFWFAYHRATEAGKFDPLPLDGAHLSSTIEALLPEAVKYTYGGACHDPLSVLREAAGAVWEAMAEREPAAVYVIEGIAETILAHHAVMWIDRRAAARAAGAAG